MKVTGGGVIASGHGCGQLQSINLDGDRCSDMVTDAGVSAATWVLHVGDLPRVIW